MWGFVNICLFVCFFLDGERAIEKLSSIERVRYVF